MYNRPAMYRHLPNLITSGRLLLAVIFLVVLNHYRYGFGPNSVLVASFVLFIIAAVTDWLDGFLARRWEVETSFGRIMDPVCDKVLVLGAFIMLAGPRFVDPQRASATDDAIIWAMIPGNTVSGVYPWMVAVMLGRELLVTAIRGELEGRGIKFGAKIWGKLKTILQLITIPTILAIVWLDPFKQGHEWMRYVRMVMVYATVIVTVISGIPYINGAAAALKGLSKS
jgi:CDP-diacylglycerol--glycerol-3-phosphate 3-phosphatidyltransferase